MECYNLLHLIWVDNIRFWCCPGLYVVPETGSWITAFVALISFCVVCQPQFIEFTYCSRMGIILLLLSLG